MHLDWMHWSKVRDSKTYKFSNENFELVGHNVQNFELEEDEIINLWLYAFGVPKIL
jgi:hypothetical protein